MFCNHCGRPILEDSKFCSNCGARLLTAAPPPYMPAPPLSTPVEPVSGIPVPPVSARLQRKGTLRVPILILAALCVVGLTLFALFPGDSAPPVGSSQAGWFENIEGFLYFDESRYSGTKELTVPGTVNGETVTHIGEQCFYDCDDLTTVILPDTLDGILYQGFGGCDRLRGISIPEGVTFIGEEAFAGCDALEAITIPQSTEFLAADAFDGCDHLKFVFFSGTKAEWTALFAGNLNPEATVYCSDGEI